MTDAYPSRNPFPPLATLTVEGRANFNIEDVPTAPRQPMERLVGLLDRYLGDDPTERAGWAVAVHGAHGTGKTHTLLYALSTAVRSDRTNRPPLALYARADTPEPLGLYRKLVGQLALPDLTRIVEDAFAGYAAETLSTTPGAGELADEMRSDTSRVIEAVRSKEFSWSDIVGRQQADLERIQRRYGRFERGVRALLEPSLTRLAYVWSTGGQLEADDLKRLGVDANITEPEQTIVAVHVLAALARAARRPFVVVLDQVEAFLETSDGEPVAGNPGWLRALLEAIATESGFFVAAMGERAWRKLPPDLPMRFGPSEIPLLGLTEADAERVLASYLAPWHQGGSGSAYAPFESNGIRQLLVVSGGNLRRFLQASRVVFDRAAHDQARIDSALVIDAASRIAQRAPTDEEVRQVVERVLAAQQLSVQSGQSIDGGLVDYALVRGDNPLLIVQVVDAVFAAHEAEVAAAHVETIIKARELKAPIVLVVHGYSSPEVTTRLEAAATQLVGADDISDFERNLKKAIREALEETSPDDTSVLENRLEELRAELIRLADTRQEEEKLVAERVRTAREDMSEAQRAEELRKYRQSWSQERQRLEDDIRRARGERRQADIAQVVELHQTYLRQRRTELLLIAGVGALAAVVAITVFATSRGSQDLSIIAGAAGYIAVASTLLGFWRWWRDREAEAGPMRTVDDVERQARGVRVGRPRSRDPYRRYAALLDADFGNQSMDSLLDLAKRERADILRRRIVGALAWQAPEGAYAALQSNLDEASLSVAVEAAASRYGADPLRELPPGRLSDRLCALSATWGYTIGGFTFLDEFVAQLRGRSDAGGPIAGLAEAYLDDDDEVLVDVIAKVPDRVLRRTTTLLSPLDDDGLGVFYWLDRIAEIDELFLFFRKCAFFAATGLPVEVEVS